MLKEIYIQNLAVIREAVIPLNGSLNIFTGETGAGKSILINGINAVLGQRCTKDIVRTGCEKAVITALFTDLSPEISAKLDELGISHENSEITVTREISADGGSVSRVNHRTASASLLREIGSMLINIIRYFLTARSIFIFLMNSAEIIPFLKLIVRHFVNFSRLQENLAILNVRSSPVLSAADI